MIDRGVVRCKWIRFPILVIGALVLGSAFTVAILVWSEGLRPTSALLGTQWEELKNSAAPALAVSDRFFGRTPTRDDRSVFAKAAEYLLRNSSVQRCAFARETRWSTTSETTPSSLNLKLADDQTRGRPFDRSAVSDLVNRNRRFLRLDRTPLPNRGVLVSNGVLDNLIRNYEQTWREELSIHHEGAVGYLVFSRPGFTSDGKQAIVYVELVCGPTCGGGYYLQFERKATTWELVSEYEDWVS